MSASWFEKTSIADLAGSANAEIPLESFSRLAALALPDNAPILVRCNVVPAENELALLDGEIEGSLKLACQRCLDPMQVEVTEQLRIALSATEVDEQLIPGGYELLVIPSGQLRLADLLEDELLLELPLSPRHPDGQCGALAQDLERLEQPAADTITPFSGLADMLRDRH